MAQDTGKQIDLGLMGLGHWPRQAYLPVLKERSDVRVVAVSVRSEATRRFAREQFGADVRLHADYHELANDPDVDAVAIALPNEQHADAIEAALAANKHVFFEPPIALTLADTRRVFARMAASNRIVQSDLELRCLPVLGAVRDLLATGRIGEPLTARIRLWCDWGAGPEMPFAYAEDQGFFLWLGCWYLDVLDFLFEASPTHAAVTGGYAMNGRLMDHGWANLTYPDGRIGQFEFSLVAVEGTDITLHVAGTRGEIEADLENGTYRWRQKDAPFRQADAPASRPACGFVGMRESIIDFLTAVRTGRPPRADLEATRRVHEAAFACAQAEADHRRVPIPPLSDRKT